MEIGSSGFLTPRRVSCEELLDQGAGTLQDVRQSLDEMWRMNRLFGGNRLLMQHLAGRLKAQTGRVSVVDVGAGSGKLIRNIAKQAGRSNVDINPLGVDIASRHLVIARENLDQTDNHTLLLQADAMHLPFASNSVDYFISSLFMHHFEPDELTHLLHRLYRSAKRGIIMSDLRRNSFSLLGFRVIQPVLARHELTKHDGLASFRRAYTPRELHAIASDAGIVEPRIISDLPWQMTLIANKRHV